jgi:hypothetical protein
MEADFFRFLALQLAAIVRSALHKSSGRKMTLRNKRDFSLFFSCNGAETANTLQPVDQVFLRRVKKRIALLRELDGVAGAELEINRRFYHLLSRYDHVGGLRRLFAEFNREPEPL